MTNSKNSTNHFHVEEDSTPDAGTEGIVELPGPVYATFKKGGEAVNMTVTYKEFEVLKKLSNYTAQVNKNNKEARDAFKDYLLKYLDGDISYQEAHAEMQKLECPLAGYLLKTIEGIELKIGTGRGVKAKLERLIENRTNGEKILVGDVRKEIRNSKGKTPQNGD